MIYKYPIIDLHATWLVINPIQGCPNRCKYCFLNGVGLTGVKPNVLVSAREAVHMLKESILYNEQIPICIESQSDAFATSNNIEYVKELIDIMDEQKIMNTKIFITKCNIPESFIEFLKKYKKLGHSFIFFLSYSGLDSDIELGVNKTNIKNNFIKLKENEFDIIHYWRPFIPQNSSKKKIMEVVDFVKQYAKCSVAIGLKAQKTFMDKIDFWDEIKKYPEAIYAESIWTKEAYEYIYGKNSIINNNYPIFQTTSCAIAFVKRECDRNAFYDSEICKKYNKCPENQRRICKDYYNAINKNISEDIIIELLKNLKVDIKNIKVHINYNLMQIIIDGVELGMKEFTYLTQITRFKVIAKKMNEDYYWNTSVNNAKQLHI